MADRYDNTRYRYSEYRVGNYSPRPSKTWGCYGFCRKFGRQIRPVYVCRPRFGGERVMIEFKGSHFKRDVILWAVRWYVAYPISYRQLEEMMEEHGVEVDHATLNRLGAKVCPAVGAGIPSAQASRGPQLANG